MNGLEEFRYYAEQSPVGLEVIPATLYDMEFYTRWETTFLQFFARTKNHMSQSNLYFPGMLPNPCAFLIEHIRINGINSNLQFGSGRLEIGNKHYGANPAWFYGMKEKGMRLNPALMIAPLQQFRFSLQWEIAQPLGNGLTGLPKEVQPIQVVLIGKMARSIA